MSNLADIQTLFKSKSSCFLHAGLLFKLVSCFLPGLQKWQSLFIDIAKKNRGNNNTTHVWMANVCLQKLHKNAVLIQTEHEDDIYDNNFIFSHKQIRIKLSNI